MSLSILMFHVEYKHKSGGMCTYIYSEKNFQVQNLSLQCNIFCIMAKYSYVRKCSYMNSCKSYEYGMCFIPFLMSSPLGRKGYVCCVRIACVLCNEAHLYV